jgi:hypothetical protein
MRGEALLGENRFTPTKNREALLIGGLGYATTEVFG